MTRKACNVKHRATKGFYGIFHSFNFMINFFTSSPAWVCVCVCHISSNISHHDMYLIMNKLHKKSLIFYDSKVSEWEGASVLMMLTVHPRNQLHVNDILYCFVQFSHILHFSRPSLLSLTLVPLGSYFSHFVKLSNEGGKEAIFISMCVTHVEIT
jgi:hypothetical protein